MHKLLLEHLKIIITPIIISLIYAHLQDKDFTQKSVITLALHMLILSYAYKIYIFIAPPNPQPSLTASTFPWQTKLKYYVLFEELVLLTEGRI